MSYERKTPIGRIKADKLTMEEEEFLLKSMEQIKFEDLGSVEQGKLFWADWVILMLKNSRSKVFSIDRDVWLERLRHLTTDQELIAEREEDEDDAWATNEEEVNG